MLTVLEQAKMEFYMKHCQPCKIGRPHIQGYKCRIDERYMHCPLTGERLSWTNRYIGRTVE